jgi:transposase
MHVGLELDAEWFVLSEGGLIMRYELSDEERTANRPMLPNKPRGVPRVNDHRVLNGIFWVLRSGATGATCRITLVRTRPATIA